MAFDAAVYPGETPAPAPTLIASIDAMGDLCPVWTQQNPDRALALLFVAPQDCVAVDILTSL